MKNTSLIFFLVIHLFCNSQNLVPNPSFEVLDSCPTFNDIYLAKPWCGTSGDEDVYSSCGNPLFQASVPFTPFNMYQYPKTGNCFIGLDFYIETGFLDYQRNYAHVQLKQVLQINRKYIVSYFINLNNDSQYAISNIDALLTSSSPNCSINSSFSFTTILATPQIKNNTGILLDTLNWIHVCDTLTSLGNEEYLILGNFNSNATTNVLKAYPSAGRIICLVNIDDVSVEELVSARCVNDTILCSGESIQLGLNQTETATYNWQPNIGLSCSFCANPTAEPSITTTYILTKQDCNIITKDSVTITVKNDCNLQAQIPNVFTPNYDGINDVFKIELKNATLTNFSIYDRWGILVKSDDIKSHTTILWDGRTTAGEVCTAGVYFYILQYTDANGDIQKKNGYITLIK